jgi:ring-1,2-phenylacetyl-CoA epoxidase subunit PaaC
MQTALANLWKYTSELFIPVDYEQAAFESGIGVDLTTIQEAWLQQIKNTFEEATLPTDLFLANGWSGLNGKQGLHTEHMGYILAELQYVQRAYPNSEW